MDTYSLPFTVAPPPSRCALLAAFFQARAGQWIDGRELATIAGAYGWRTRVSNLRKPPFNLTVENRLRRVEQADGTRYTVSEYRLMTEPTTCE